MLPRGAFTTLLLLWGAGLSAVIGELALPPVDLSEKDSGILVNFTHPRLFYKGREELKQLDSLNFTVSTDFGDFPSSCSAGKSICRRVLSFPGGVEKCVRVSRAFMDGVAFRDTGRICLSISPPTNFTLSCRNLSVVASWTHSSRQPPVTFRVQVGGSAGYDVNETREHQFDLSRSVWASEDHYMGFHFVTVTAVEAGNQSAPVTTTFTFNDNTPAYHKCQLDFPPVILTENDSGATVSFMNPFTFYKELRDAKKPDTAVFTFTASSESGHFDGECSVKQEKCKLDISFPEDKEKCVHLGGTLMGWNKVGNIVFRQTRRICASTSSELHAVALAIILFVLLVIVSLIVICVCKVKAWTMKLPSPPEPLIKVNQQEGSMRYAPVSGAEISEVTVDTPCKNPSESSEEEKLQDCSSARRELPPADRLYAERDPSEGYRGGEDSANSSVKTVSMDLEEMEEEVCAYDRPQNLQVELGDGEMVSAYTKTEPALGFKGI